MKLFYQSLLIGTIICAGCGSKEVEEVIPPDTPAAVPIELDLVHKEQIRLWCKSSFSFEAFDDGEYTIESQNPQVAEARVDGSIFTIKTHMPGETNIIIRNNLGGKSILKCYSRTFTNVWSEAHELEEILNYKNSMMVVAQDKLIADKIEQELKPTISNRGYEFRFTEETNELSVLLPAQGSPVKGTYEWDFQTQTLTLCYKGITERYTCDIQPEYPNFWVHQPRFIIEIKQDLTEKYALQYPEAGIEDVYVIRHIMALGDWWLTEREIR